MSEHVFTQHFTINREARSAANNHKSLVLWFTGLSGSGKSTLANLTQQYLFEKGLQVYVLDGDNIRLGLNKDLDFSEAGRKENIRRIAEVSRLMMDAGLIVITSFVSPFIADREMAGKIIGAENFLEIFVNSPVEICEKRDVKGLYEKARKGEIINFTGISSPYEPPVSPFLTIETGVKDVQTCMLQIQHAIEERIKL